jgi:hypothetical protein
MASPAAHDNLKKLRVARHHLQTGRAEANDQKA